MAYMCVRFHGECVGCGGCAGKVFGTCCQCEADIYDGDPYYDLEQGHTCEDCVQAARCTAEVDDWEDET